MVNAKMVLIQRIVRIPLTCSIFLKQFMRTRCLKQYKNRLLLRRIHHFETDFINNMDYTRISGTEASSVTLLKLMLEFVGWEQIV